MRKLVLIFLLFHSSLGIAQIRLSTAVSAAVEQALELDLELVNQDIERQKLELERKNVWNKYIPKVQANANYGYLNSEASIDLKEIVLPNTGYPLFSGQTDFANSGQLFHGGVMAKTVLFSGGQIQNGAKALAHKNKGTSLLMELNNEEVIKDLILSFDQLQLLIAAQQLIDESQKRLDKETERVEKAIALGLAVPYEREKIKLATLELKSKRMELEQLVQLMALKISQATGYTALEVLGMEHVIEPIVILNELFSEDRNEIKALVSFKEASEYALKKEKGTLLPNVAAFGGYSYTSFNNFSLSTPLPNQSTAVNLNLNHLQFSPTWMIGIGLKWNLFDGFERKNRIETARLDLKQIQNKLEDTREKINLQLERAKISYESSLQQIDVANQRQLIAQNNNLLAEKQFAGGLISVTDRLTAEQDLYKESLNTIETIINQRKAAIETYQAVGTLSSFLTIK